MADEGLTAGAVARRLGVAVTTLRTWHQRYGLGPSGHEPGRHRRYTAADLDRLQVMRRLTAQGVPPAEAAAWARRAASHTDRAAESPGSRPRDPEGTSSPGPAAPRSDDSSAGASAPRSDDTSAGASAPRSDDTSAGASAPRPEDPFPAGSASLSVPDHGVARRTADPGAPGRRRHDGGGQAIALGPATPAARGLARAAMRLDASAMRDILDAAIIERGVVASWTDVAAPVLIGIGERYAATGRFVEVEHLISRCVTEALGGVPRPASAVLPRVLLAAADDEQHTLPLEALAAALAEVGLSTRLLGARVPPRALGDAVARTGPDVVVLWAQVPRTGDPAQLARLARAPRPPMMIAAAGPGWPTELPAGVVRLTSLSQAVGVVGGALA